PFYILAQIVGAFLSTGMIYLCYYSTIHHFTGGTDGPVKFAALYVTQPNNYVNTGYTIWVEFISTAVLTLIAFNLTDANNNHIIPSPMIIPPLIGLMIFLIIIGVGYQGVSISPAR
ncbi:11280_t:CDS:2, partial [Acaulospora morrowiae]